jgi:hypothetical protein
LLFPVKTYRRLDSPNLENSNIFKISINDQYCVTDTTSFEREKVDDDFVPLILVAIHTIQNAETRKAMVALLDTGSTRLFIHQSSLPSAATPTLSKKPLISNTAAGKLESQTEVDMTGIVCREFTRPKGWII